MTQQVNLPDATGDRLTRSTLQLLISNVASAVLGITFWVVAARLYTAHDVGRGVGEITAMTMLAAISFLNLGTIFPRFLFAAGARSGVVLRVGYLASMTLGFVGAIVFLLVTLGHRSYMEPGLWPSVFFVGAVVLWVIFTIEDAALVGFRRTFWVPVENTSFSVVKIALLPIFLIVAPGVGVFSSWVLPVVACTIAINLYLWRRVMPAHVAGSAGAGVIPERRVLGKVVFGEYLGSLSFTAMWNLPGLMVIAVLGVTQAAYFQTPWLAGTSFDALLYTFATVLIVEATTRPSTAPGAVRRSVRLALVILGPTVVAIVVAAPWFLRVLGPNYAKGTHLLQLLAIALPFQAVNVLYVTYARLARRVRRVVFVQASIAVMVLTLTITLLKPMGITGAGVAYLSAMGLTALVLLPSVVAQYRRPDMSHGFGEATPLVVRTPGATPEPIEVEQVELLTDTVVLTMVEPALEPTPHREVPSIWRRLEPGDHKRNGNGAEPGGRVGGDAAAADERSDPR